MLFKKLIVVFFFLFLLADISTAQIFPINNHNGNMSLKKSQNYLQSKQLLESLQKEKNIVDSENENYSFQDLKTKKIGFLFSNVDESVEKLKSRLDSLIKNNKDSLDLKKIKKYLRNTPVNDSANLANINTKIEAIKAYNLMEFLTSDKSPKAFWLNKSSNYNIDSLNKYIYNQKRMDVFQAAALQNFSNSNVVAAELGSFLAGPLRIGVGGSFLTKGDTSKDNAIKKSIQQILSNGGEFNITFSMPLLYYRSRKENFHFGVFAQSNFGINPSFDSTTKTTDFSNSVSFNNQSGLDIHIDLGANDNKGGLYVDFPLYYVWGNNILNQNLSLPDFSVLKMQAGIQIGGLINFRVSGSLFSSSKTVQKMPYIVSIQFSPSQIAKSSN